jgi:NitT/TauT family transport system substrate-binding protein
MSERRPWSSTALVAPAFMPIALAGAAIIAWLAPAGWSYGQPAVTTINVAIQPAATALPLVVADKKGLFAKRNIEGKWTVSRVPISDLINTLGRQFDVTMGTQPSLIAAAGGGIPVVAITGGALDTPGIPTSNIVARGDSGITAIKQLAGKTIGTLTLTGNIHFALLNAFQKEGVDLDSIHWVVGTIPQLPDLLKAGRVDAIEEIEPFASIAIASGGVALGDPFRSIGDRALVGYWLSQRDWADKNKDLVLSFTTAMSEAADWIDANKDEAKSLLSSYTGLQGPVLEKTPIPGFSFSPTAADLQKQLVPDLQTWNDILKRTSDIKPVEPHDLLPSWIK